MWWFSSCLGWVPCDDIIISKLPCSLSIFDERIHLPDRLNRNCGQIVHCWPHEEASDDVSTPPKEIEPKKREEIWCVQWTLSTPPSACVQTIGEGLKLPLGFFFLFRSCNRGLGRRRQSRPARCTEPSQWTCDWTCDDDDENDDDDRDGVDQDEPGAGGKEDDSPAMCFLPSHHRLLLLREVAPCHLDIGSLPGIGIHPGFLHRPLSHRSQLGVVGWEEGSEELAASSQALQPNVVKDHLLDDKQESVIRQIDQAYWRWHLFLSGVYDPKFSHLWWGMFWKYQCSRNLAALFFGGGLKTTKTSR